MPEPRFAAARPRCRERPRRRRSSRRRARELEASIASPTARCGSRTACTGTCARCHRDVERAARRRPRRRRRRRRLGRRLRPARRRRPLARPAVSLPRRAHGGHGRARVRARRRATSSTPRPASRHGDQHRLPAARRRGHGRAGRARRGCCSSRTCSPSGSAARRPTRSPRRAPPACSTRARATGRATRSSGSGCRRACSAALVEPGTTLGPLLAACTVSTAPRRARRRRARHRLGLRGRAGARRRRRDPLQRDLVAARARAARARARPAAAAANLTNERGVDATTRLLKNVMGLWLVQECRRAWRDADYDELHRLARRGTATTCALIDPDDEALPGAGRHAGADRRALRAHRPAAARDARRDRCARSCSRWRASTASCCAASSA